MLNTIGWPQVHLEILPNDKKANKKTRRLINFSKGSVDREFEELRQDLL